MYVEGDVPVSTGNNNNGFGNGWEGLIGLALVAGLFDGGFGFGNGGNGGYDAAIQRGFDTQSVLSKLEGINGGICDGFYAMNTGMLNGFGQVQQTLCAGFGGLTGAVNTNGYETRSAIADLGYNLQSCCCQTQRAIDGVNYNMATNTNAIIQAGNANTQRVLDFLCNEKIGALQSENSVLKGQLSQNAQTQTIKGGYFLGSQLNSSQNASYGLRSVKTHSCINSTGAFILYLLAFSISILILFRLFNTPLYARLKNRRFLK